MKFKLDENLPTEAAEILTQAGYDAHTVLQEELGGTPDSKISAVCKSEQRALVTLDTDFCNILNYPPQDHAGIIVIRALDQSKRAVLSFVRQIAATLDVEDVDGKLWIVQKGSIRIR